LKKLMKYALRGAPKHPLRPTRKRTPGMNQLVRIIIPLLTRTPEGATSRPIASFAGSLVKRRAPRPAQIPPWNHPAPPCLPPFSAEPVSALRRGAEAPRHPPHFVMPGPPRRRRLSTERTAFDDLVADPGGRGLNLAPPRHSVESARGPTRRPNGPRRSYARASPPLLIGRGGPRGVSAYSVAQARTAASP